MRFLSAFGIGLLFATGLIIAGMTQPGKIYGFFDVFGAWDPSLIFVMGGAIGVHAPLLHLLKKRNGPIYGEKFGLPTRQDLTPRLLLGSALFGIGFGGLGFCPGPAMVAASSGAKEAIVFLPAMFAGMFLFKVWDERNLPADAPQSEAVPNC